MDIQIHHIPQVYVCGLVGAYVFEEGLLDSGQLTSAIPQRHLLCEEEHSERGHSCFVRHSFVFSRPHVNVTEKRLRHFFQETKAKCGTTVLY